MERFEAVLPAISHWRGDRPRRDNIGAAERFVSVATGAALMGWGLVRLVRGRGVQGLAGGATGLVLARRGILGRSRLYDLLGVESDDATRFSTPLTREVHVRCAVRINASAGDLYRCWRNVQDLPNIMRHIIRVEDLGDGRSWWEARTPFGGRVSWESKITADRPGRVIAWQSLPGGQVETSGRLDFMALPRHRGTALRVNLVYRPPAGAFGAAAAKLLGADPAGEIDEDLRRFKQLIEAGEIATSAMARPGREHQALAPSPPRVERREVAGRQAAAGAWSEDAVEEASMESFPASDAPGWIGHRRPESERA